MDSNEFENEQVQAAPDEEQLQDQGTDSSGERRDWKGEAEYYRGFVEAMQRQGQQPQAEQRPDPQMQAAQEINQLQNEVQTLENTAPELDMSSVEGFRKHQDHMQKLQQARFRLQQAENRQMQMQMMEQNSRTAIEQFKQQARASDDLGLFEEIESEFDQAVRNMAPQNRGNHQLLETVRRNLEQPILRERLRTGQVTQGQARQQQQRRPAPGAPSAAYNQQPAPEQKTPQWKSEKDRRAAARYGYTPEQYYKDRPSVPDGQEGTQIYFPTRRN